MGRFYSSLTDESGQGMVEYGLIIGLVAIAVIGALVVFGPKVGQMYNDITLHNALN